jgi:pilus assembly protein Flp/PilA
MPCITSRVARFLTSEDGPTPVEYAFKLSLILVACASVITNLGRAVNTRFGQVNTAATSAASGSDTTPAPDPAPPGHSKSPGFAR